MRGLPVWARRKYQRGSGLCSCFGACPTQPFRFRKDKAWADIITDKPQKVVSLVEVLMLLDVALGSRGASSFMAEGRKAGWPPACGLAPVAGPSSSGTS